MPWYLSFFQDTPSNAKAVGELSHDYLFSPKAAERIATNLPAVTLMTCLRHPVERTFSHYLYMIRSGRTKEAFEIALKQFPELINNSIYHKHLAQYFHLFDTTQIKVLFFDDLQSDPAALARSVFDSLHLRYLDGIDYDKRVLPSSMPRSYFLARIAKMGALCARDAGLGGLVGSVKRGILRQILYKPYEPNGRPRVNPRTKAELEDLFRPGILILQDMLQVNLTHWIDKDTSQRR
jgi:hypothetical protein